MAATADELPTRGLDGCRRHRHQQPRRRPAGVGRGAPRACWCYREGAFPALEGLSSGAFRAGGLQESVEAVSGWGGAAGGRTEGCRRLRWSRAFAGCVPRRFGHHTFALEVPPSNTEAVRWSNSRVFEYGTAGSWGRGTLRNAEERRGYARSDGQLMESTWHFGPRQPEEPGSRVRSRAFVVRFTGSE